MIIITIINILYLFPLKDNSYIKKVPFFLHYRVSSYTFIGVEKVQVIHKLKIQLLFYNLEIYFEF